MSPTPSAKHGLRDRAVRVAADASLAGVAIVWGATFPLGKLVLRHLGPFQYLALRFALATLLMAPLAWRDRERLRAAGLRAGVLAGGLLFAGAALQTVGLQYTSAGKAGLITGLNVLIIPLVLLVWKRRLPSAALAAGVTLAVAGLWLLLWRGGRAGAGDVLVLGCAFALALQTIVVGQVASAVPAAPFACVQVAIVAVLAAVPALGIESRPAAVPAGVVAAIVFMAVTATLGAYVAQAWAQRMVSSTRAGLLFAIEPVAAVGFGVAWLGETLGPRQVAGAAALLLGVVIGETGRDPVRRGDVPAARACRVSQDVRPADFARIGSRRRPQGRHDIEAVGPNGPVRAPAVTADGGPAGSAASTLH